MTRYLCWVAGLGVVALPDWAAACRPGWGPPVYVEPVVYCPPAYPVVVYPAYPVCPPPVYVYPPAPGHLLPPPRIEPQPMPKMATPAPAPAPGVGSVPPAASRPPAAPPAVEPVRPAAGSDSRVPPPPKADPPRPAADPDFPSVEIPKSLELPNQPGAKPPAGPAPGPAAPSLPAVPSPAPPDPGPNLPPLVLPTGPAPKAAGPGGPDAIPTPAPPAPDLAIPPPAAPDATNPKSAALPSLTLPPETPVNVSRSSPLTGTRIGPTVSVFPANGGSPADGYRAVGFYNHTGREIALTIEGRAVKLPAKSYLEAKLGPTFTWAHGDNPATRQTVPAAAAGLDIVFKE